jgi:hypothetical protein
MMLHPRDWADPARVSSLGGHYAQNASVGSRVCGGGVQMAAMRYSYEFKRDAVELVVLTGRSMA